ncbi:MAG: GntR family transcriptional regulator [Eubacterium sp.]
MKTYEYILGDIQEKIEKGFYKPEEQLPSLREFAKIYNTTPITAKKSLSILEERGYVYVVDRKGFFVSSSKNKIYTLIFHETKSVDHLTRVDMQKVEEENALDIHKEFGLTIPKGSRCMKITSVLYNNTIPIGLDIKYLVHHSRAVFPLKNPKRLVDSLNLVLSNYDIYKDLEIQIMTDNSLVRELLFLDENDSVFEFKQIYRTATGQIAGVSETYVPCEEIQIKMKY